MPASDANSKQLKDDYEATVVRLQQAESKARALLQQVAKLESIQPAK